MCEPRSSEPNVVKITKDNAVDYLAAACLNLLTHPAPGLDHPQYAEARQAHDLAAGFVADALRKLGRSA